MGMTSRNHIYNVFSSRTNVFILENKLLSKINKFIKLMLDYLLVVFSFFYEGPVLLIIAFEFEI